jgi:cell division protease FtsH
VRLTVGLAAQVSIVPRGAAAQSFSQSLGREAAATRTSDELSAALCVALAGRAAEEVALGVVTTSAADDLARATRMAYEQV